MKKAHRYILEPYKGMNSRYRCPCCQQKEKTFTLYIDTETGEHIHPSVGRCSRESNCEYHYTPKQYFQDNHISFNAPQLKAYKPRTATPQPKPVSFIPVEVFKSSLKANETNHFVKFIINLFGVEVASELVSRYFIATSKHWNGATVFWQIDTRGKVRTGKIMLYSPTTGKRVKEPFNHINWAHKALKEPEFELRQCLFGEHLLIEKTKPVAIVESEKTAVIASVYLPQFIWVAVGSLTNLNAEKCSILKGRTVSLFPDLNGFDKWSSKAKELSHLAIFTVSDLLERKASEGERFEGLDLADYLLRFNPQEFALIGEPKTNPDPQKPSMPLPTAENITFSKMAAKCLNLKQFATALYILSLKTGKPFQIVPIEEDEQSEPPAEPVQAKTEEEPTEEAIRKLNAIAGRILIPQRSYTIEEVLKLIEATLKISSDRAKAGFQKMIYFGVIKPTWNGLHYLKDSTPF